MYRYMYMCMGIHPVGVVLRAKPWTVFVSKVDGNGWSCIHCASVVGMNCTAYMYMYFPMSKLMERALHLICTLEYQFCDPTFVFHCLCPLLD